MTEFKELRINNLFTLGGDKMKVHIIDQEHSTVTFINLTTKEQITYGIRDPEFPNPILLPDNDLEFYGFEYEDPHLWRMDGFYPLEFFYDHDNNGVKGYYQHSGSSTIGRKFFYLHQLQNLIADLTGDEMEIQGIE